MTAVLIAAVIAWQTPKVTFTTEGTTLAKAFRELNATVEPDWRVDNAMMRELVVADVKDVDQETLKARFADVFNAEWRNDGETITLWRSPDKWKAIRAAEIAKREVEMRKIVDDAKKKVAKAQPFTANRKAEIIRTVRQMMQSYEDGMGGEQMSGYEEMMSSLPDQIAVARIMASLDPAMLARLPKDQRIVFSFTPNTAQRKIDASLQAAISTSMAEFTSLYSDMIAELKDLPMYRGEEYDEQYEKFKKPISKVLFAFYPESQAQNSSARLMFYSEDGEKFYEVSNNDYYSRDEESRLGPPLPKELLKDPKKLKGGWIQQAYEAWQNDENAKDLPKAILDVVKLPEQHDPISWQAGPYMVEAAKGRNFQFLGHVTDDMVNLGWADYAYEEMDLEDSEASPEEAELTDVVLFRQMSRVGMLAVKDGWMTQQPNDLEAELARQMDRAAIGNFVRAGVDFRDLTVSGQAAFYSRLPRDEQYFSLLSFISGYLDIFSGVEDVEAHTLRVWGGLGDAAVQTLVSGRSLQVSALPASVQRDLRDMIFKEVESLHWSGKPQDPNKPEQKWDFRDWLRTEPTEACPTGTVLPAVLSAKSVPTPIIKVTYTNKDGEVYVSNLDTRGLASALASEDFTAEQPKKPGTQNYEPWRVSTVKLGTRNTVTFRLDVAPQVYAEFSIRDDRMPNGPGGGLDSLPQALQAEIEKARLEMLEAKRKARSRTGDPPPPFSWQ